VGKDKTQPYNKGWVFLQVQTSLNSRVVELEKFTNNSASKLKAQKRVAWTNSFVRAQLSRLRGEKLKIKMLKSFFL
jgi:hypothetical protein